MKHRQTLFLSHVLSAQTPGYGGLSGFCTQPRTSIAQGQSSNSCEWTLSNHIGTHVDVPRHFSDSGASIEFYPAEFWIFRKPVLVDYLAKPAELIAPDAWTNSIPMDADLLLLRTGFEAHRATSLYWEQNPGFSPALGDWLRINRPNIRAIGSDILSATSWQHRETGREAHRRFLSPEFPGQPVLIIEDMTLAALTRSPDRITVSPLRVFGSDGGPVTVISELNETK